MVLELIQIVSVNLLNFNIYRGFMETKMRLELHQIDSLIWWNSKSWIIRGNEDVVGFRSDHEREFDEIENAWINPGGDVVVGMLWELMKIVICHRLIVSIFGIVLALTPAPRSMRSWSIFSVLCVHA